MAARCPPAKGVPWHSPATNELAGSGLYVRKPKWTTMKHAAIRVASGAPSFAPGELGRASALALAVARLPTRSRRGQLFMLCQLIGHGATWPTPIVTRDRSRPLCLFASFVLTAAWVYFDTPKAIVLPDCRSDVLSAVESFRGLLCRLAGPRLSCCDCKNGSEGSLRPRRTAQDPKVVAIPIGSGGHFCPLLRFGPEGIV